MPVSQAIERTTGNLWRGSLLPLGRVAAPALGLKKTGPAAQSSGSKLPRHSDSVAPQLTGWASPSHTPIASPAKIRTISSTN
ncbi:hypothetical protein EXW72_00135 [Pseudomonas sp. BCA14]|nr:hypothetical protein EXW70_03555 [Pseudomonas sp. JMN1]TFF15703.1 hypothetical protein EXW71_05485 [Pseudomonas sp. BCA17]TFF30480.1 hypothetical protein EXW72_00135 [Pseudomonas sp. BCA14]TFF33063.1 hypothetical protein EXW73_04735 [Pseudomonas sp. BCA13]